MRLHLYLKCLVQVTGFAKGRKGVFSPESSHLRCPPRAFHHPTTHSDGNFYSCRVPGNHIQPRVCQLLRLLFSAGVSLGIFLCVAQSCFLKNQARIVPFFGKLQIVWFLSESMLKLSYGIRISLETEIPSFEMPFSREIGKSSSRNLAFRV